MQTYYTTKLSFINNSSKINSLFQKFLDALTTHLVAIARFIFFYTLGKGNIYNEKEIKETIKNHDRFIIAMNHESYLDWIIIWAIFRYKFNINIVFLAKSKLFNHPLWGKIMRHAKCVKVSDKGAKILDLESKERLKHSIIGIFPEGKRSRTGELLEFKSGVAVMAAKFNIPILPISLNGFYESWRPESKLPKAFPMNIVVAKLITNSGDYSIRDYLSKTKEHIELGIDLNQTIFHNLDTMVFDLDSTLTRTSIADLLFYMNKKYKTRLGYAYWKIGIIPFVPVLKLLDAIYRPLCQLIIFRMYDKYSVETMKNDAREFIKLKLSEVQIKKSFRFSNRMRNAGKNINIVSTNLSLFVEPIAEQLKAEAYGISLSHLRKLSFMKKLKYLQTFKSNIVGEILENKGEYIGIGDSKYDKPIFNNAAYSILVYSKKKRTSLSKNINHYMSLDIQH